METGWLCWKGFNWIQLLTPEIIHTENEAMNVKIPEKKFTP